LRLNDNSHPEDIKTVLKMSKKPLKKEKLIEIKEDGIYLIRIISTCCKRKKD
jgi:predicted RNA-binding protein (virulence factor B family)